MIKKDKIPLCDAPCAGHSRGMRIYLERIYDPPAHAGYRVLADRIWPRGVSKDKAALDEWCKDVAPSTALRQWYKHDREKWPEFSRLYRAELLENAAAAQALLERRGHKNLILLTATKDMDHTHIIVLKDYLASL